MELTFLVICDEGFADGLSYGVDLGDMASSLHPHPYVHPHELLRPQQQQRLLQLVTQTHTHREHSYCTTWSDLTNIEPLNVTIFQNHGNSGFDRVEQLDNGM